MHKALWVLFLTVGIPFISAAEVYKCTVDGAIKYQALPCDGGEQSAVRLRTAPASAPPAADDAQPQTSEQKLLDQLTAEREALEAKRQAERERQQALAFERKKIRAAEREARAQEVRNELLRRALSR